MRSLAPLAITRLPYRGCQFLPEGKDNRDSSEEMSCGLAMGMNEREASAEELLDLARANAQALIIATTGYLAQAGIPLEGWSDYLGQVFAASWDESMAGDPRAFLQTILANYQALGATVVATNFAPGRADATIEGFPNAGLCQELDADCALAEAYHAIGAALAERLGLTWRWDSRDGSVMLVVTMDE